MTTDCSAAAAGVGSRRRCGAQRALVYNCKDGFMLANRFSRDARGALLIAALTIGLVAISAAPAVASRSCGTTPLKQGGRASVTIARGPISCSKARATVRLYGTGAVHYTCRSHAHSCLYSTYPHGWRCGPLEMGGSACWLGGTNTAHARAVELTLVFGASRSSTVRIRATSAAACAKEQVNGGKYLGRLTLRFRTIGPVSCAKAHALARTWFRKFATGHCGQQNNFCDLTFDDWSCGFFFATEVQQTGGAKAGCAREHGGARVRFYWASPQQQAADPASSTKWRRAAARFRECGRFNALHVDIEVSRVSCIVARRIVQAYMHGRHIGVNETRVVGFPAWTCSTGDRLGTYSNEKVRPRAPAIGFSYL
jgi:hypothetical protein